MDLDEERNIIRLRHPLKALNENKFSTLLNPNFKLNFHSLSSSIMPISTCIQFIAI